MLFSYDNITFICQKNKFLQLKSAIKKYFCLIVKHGSKVYIKINQ